MTRIVKKFKILSGKAIIDTNSLNHSMSFLLDGEYKLTIEPLSPEGVSKKQRYYFLCVDQLAKYLGYTKIEMNELIKDNLSKDVIINNNKEQLINKSISNMSEEDLVNRIRELHQWAIENFQFTFSPDI